MRKTNLVKETKEVSKNFFRAAPSTINEDDRTVEVVFSTGARGLRYGFFGDYYEELGMSKKEMRLERLQKIGAVLFGHDSRSLDSLVGTIERVSLDEKEGEARALVRFDKDEQSERVFQKVKNGILRGVSVGYNVYEYTELEEKQNDLPVFRATDWEPLEVSFVSIPFDAEATVRQRGQEEVTNCIFLRKGESDMPKKKVQKREEEVKPEEVKEEVSEEVEAEVPEEEEVTETGADVPEEVEEEAEEVSEEEAEEVEEPSDDTRSGLTAILRACDKAGLPVGVYRNISEKFISGKLTLAQAQERVIEEWSKKDKKVRGSMGIEAGSYDKMEVLTKGIRNAMLHRINPTDNTLDEMGRNFRGFSLVEMGRAYLEGVGIRTQGLSKSEIASKLLSRNTAMHVRAGFMGTDDFPYLLADVANKTLQAAYARFPQTFKPWTQRAMAPDFKSVYRNRLGEGPTLTKVTEHGEFTYGTFGEERESYALATYGKIVPMTRQMIINDDLGAFDRVINALGLNAADLESDIVWAILTANAALNDGVALFHASHGNLGTGAAPSETTLTEMRKLGRLQTGIDSKKLNIVYSYLLVPAALEVTTQKLVTSVLAAQTSNVNVFSGAYQVIVEPRLDDDSSTAWYAAAAPGRVDTIEYCYLEGNESVFIEQEVEFDTDGVKIKARHDFAAKAIDYRGLFKNAGA